MKISENMLIIDGKEYRAVNRLPETPHGCKGCVFLVTPYCIHHCASEQRPDGRSVIWEEVSTGDSVFVRLEWSERLVEKLVNLVCTYTNAYTEIPREQCAELRKLSIEILKRKYHENH